ncbi:hypothetical protein pb186bvf_003473 [Paramecium bursaria]
MYQMKKTQKEPYSNGSKDQSKQQIQTFLLNSLAKKENYEQEKFSPTKLKSKDIISSNDSKGFERDISSSGKLSDSKKVNTKPKSRDIISSNESKGFEKDLISSGKLSDSIKFKNFEQQHDLQEKGNNKIKILDVHPMTRSHSTHTEQQQQNRNKIKITEVPMNTYYKGFQPSQQQVIEVIKAPQKCLWTNKSSYKMSACGFLIQSNDFERYVQQQLETNEKFLCKCKKLASLKYLTLDHNTIFKMLKSQFKFTWDCPRQCGYFCILDIKRSAKNLICPKCMI